MTRPPELDAHAIYEAAERKKRSLRLSWTQVRGQAGISVSGGRNVFSRLGRGQLPHSHNLFLILLWIGDTDLRSFEKAGRL